MFFFFLIGTDPVGPWRRVGPASGLPGAKHCRPPPVAPAKSAGVASRMGRASPSPRCGNSRNEPSDRACTPAKGGLRGQRKAWGSRYVWEVNGEGLDEFLAGYGRLDGHRRQSRPSPAPPGPLEALLAASAPTPCVAAAARGGAASWRWSWASRCSLRRPARVLPDRCGSRRSARPRSTAVWWRRRSCCTSPSPSRRRCSSGSTSPWPYGVPASPGPGPGALALVGASLVTGSLFGSAARAHWEEFLLWWHRQPFGLRRPHPRPRRRLLRLLVAVRADAGGVACLVLLWR